MGVSLKKIITEVDQESSVNQPLSARRKKVWELERRFHCSIAGTCFTLAEMRRFCRLSPMTSSSVKTNNPVSDYNLHINFVTMLGDARTARQAVKYLDHKYKLALQHFDQADSQCALKALWEEAVSQGQIAAAYWSVVTHPLVSDDLLFRVYGEVHMLSHLAGASIRLDMQTLTQLRQRVPALEQELAQSQSELLQRTRQKDELIETLNKRLDKALQSEQKLLAAEAKIQALESGEALGHLRMQVAAYADQLNVAKIRAECAETKAAEQTARAMAGQVQAMQLENQLLELTLERSAMESVLESALATAPVFCEKREVCKQKIDLAGRSILYVGGRNRLCGHFRTLVEQQNGRFIHFDGGREESPQRLDALVSQADAVLCPLDCISHNAVHRVKLDCKRYGKHLMLLSQSSLSAFVKGVHEFSLVPSGAGG